MKSKILVGLAVATVMMLVLSMTAVPVAAERPIVKITKRMERFNRNILGDDFYEYMKSNLENMTKNKDNYPNPTTNFNNNKRSLPKTESICEKIREFNINLLGMENYTKLRDDIEGKMGFIGGKINSTHWTDYLPYYDFLLELTIFIFAICSVIGGHSVLGKMLGTLSFIVLMPIPVFLLCLVDWYFESIDMLMDEEGNTIISNLLYQWGVIGLIIGFIFALPVGLIWSFVAVPLLAGIQSFDLMLYLFQEYWKYERIDW